MCLQFIGILKQLHSTPTQLSASLLPLQGRGCEHFPRKLRCAVREAHIHQQLRQPAAGGVVALEAVGKLWVAQQFWQALPQRLASPASKHTGVGSGALTSAGQSHHHGPANSSCTGKLVPYTDKQPSASVPRVV